MVESHTNMKGDDAVKAVASEPWDPSVQSLVAFPQVLATMASKPDWVTQLGNAFLAQPNDVMDSVQRLRTQAQAAGNLKSNEQQKVIVEQSTIQIVPANTQVVYVPTYNPTVVYGTWPYPAYPPVYVPPPPGYAIASGFAAGSRSARGSPSPMRCGAASTGTTHDVNVNVNRYNNINVNNRHHRERRHHELEPQQPAVQPQQRQREQPAEQPEQRGTSAAAIALRPIVPRPRRSARPGAADACKRAPART